MTKATYASREVRRRGSTGEGARRDRETRQLFALALTFVAVLVLPAVTAAEASTKFAYAETFDAVDVANLNVAFEEGSLKRFEAVEYQLDATAVVTWTCAGGQSVAEQLFPSTSLAVAPDDKGRVSGSATLDLDRSPAGPCPGVGFSVAHSNLMLTNLRTGHVYRLDSIARTLP